MINRSCRFLGFSIGLLLFALCSCVSDSESIRDDMAALNRFLDSSSVAVNAGDVEAEVNRFTEDGIYMCPDMPALKGHNEIRRFFRQRFASVDVGIKNITEDLQVGDSWAYEWGIYEAIIKPKNTDKADTVYGKYLNILKKLPDGSWRISHRMRNLDHPTKLPQN